MKLESIYVFIYVDALPLEYVSSKYMPHLFKLLNGRKEAIQIIQNIPGYSFGIQSTMLSGLLPQESYHWMPFMFKIENVKQPFGYLKDLCNYNPLICNELVLKTIGSLRNIKHEEIRFLYEAILHVSVFWDQKGVKLHGIPMGHLEKILVFPYYYMNEIPFFLMLKKELEERYGMGVYYFGHSLKRGIEGLSRLLRMHKGEYSKLFIWKYIDDLDGVGHKKGVASREWFNSLESVDYFISITYRYLSSMGRDVKILLFSDHGMCNADEYIDLENLLSRLPRGTIDFVVDATLAFIRVHSDATKERLLDFLKRKLKDKVLIFDVEEDKQLLRRHGVYFANGEYGEIIVQTKPCKGFFPNFYSVSRRLKGLHGFWPNELVQRAFIVTLPSRNESSITPSHIKDLSSYIRSILA